MGLLGQVRLQFIAAVLLIPISLYTETLCKFDTLYIPLSFLMLIVIVCFPFICASKQTVTKIGYEENVPEKLERGEAGRGGRNMTKGIFTAIAAAVIVI